MQIPVCPLCKSENSEVRFSEKPYDLNFCNTCELFFIHPYPSDIDQQHDRVRDYSYEEIEIINPESKYLSEIQFYRRYFPLIDQECNGAASILDVGCGSGRLLELLRKYPDLIKIGIELNSSRAEMARKIAGCEILQVPIESFSIEKQFDVITMINVLSHIPFFDSLFSSIRSLMAENGKLILKVSEMSKDVKKGAMYDWAIPDHLQFLGLNTVNYICDKYGFKILKHYRIPFSDDLFSKERFVAPGRNATRNTFKKVVLYTPYALSLLKRFYNISHGNTIFSSLIVLGMES